MKLPKKHKSPNAAIQAVAETIRAAMTERRLEVPALTEMLGLEKSQRGAVSHWVVGKNGPGPHVRPKLAEILGLTEEQLTVPGSRRAVNFQPPGEHMGPARRAVTLVATHTRAPEILTPPPGPPPVVVTDVFVIRARSDGTMQVRLDANLPYVKGSQLVQYLLSFGLVIGAEEPP